MNKIIKGIVIAAIAVLAIIGGVSGISKFFSSPTGLVGDASTGYPDGLTVGGGTYAVSPALAVTGAVTVSGQLSGSSGIVSSTINSTSTTATSETMSATDLVGYSVISITPNTGALTVTLPASSTLSTYLPNAGDSTSFVLFNASTTALQTVTIAAGTGTLLEVASTTATAVTAPAKASRITVFRKPNSDLVFLQQNFF